ncbi:uncharacterized protein TRUGW13939_10878 [Talaromyces rugulosus]|uniref:D-isomer specific 2-hydroxyacid dehydrogenase NAD-binding domain-containing protein n=1 Tax=Talaromyces rugulosus TaxID=121627 RepID=A0A7H8RC96_TALRU|nr:uncharacterized protein TRUGW13939_10878 [Talaromyces rugulosus]QKX63707.1 hypothetical protein TRUGW13939_10878 [Talaromyces rugulosus]
MSSIRGGPEKSFLFHYRNISYWKDFAVGSEGTAQFSSKRLSCRAMVEIFKSKSSATVNSNMTHSPTEIENDLVKSSMEYIQEEYQRSDCVAIRTSWPQGSPTTTLRHPHPALPKPNRQFISSTSSTKKPLAHARTIFNGILPEDEGFADWKKNASALLIRGSYLTAEDIASCPNLIAIGKHGVGIDKIDQKACGARGIRICNTPGANARDVAELVLALSVTVARDIRSITTRQMTRPIPKETCNGLTLYKKTLEIIGMGNIGRTVAEIFRGAFDANVVAYDVFMPDGAWPHISHRSFNDMEEVIKRADVVSIHVPLTEETRDMISYKEIRMMKPDAILINAARGGIVNKADLTTALSEGHLWGAGLDCHEQEPPLVRSMVRCGII